MNKLLHIIATPRGGESRTLKVSSAFLENFTKKYPECGIEELNLFTEELPSLTVKTADGRTLLLSGRFPTEKLKDAWRSIERHIERFLSADAYLVSVPMWNFNIPYQLKQYIDIIVQPKYLFRYTDAGVEGLAKNKKMVVVTSRGGNYPPGSPDQSFDNELPYLRTIFGYAGITDITFVIAEPMDMGIEIQKAKIEEAKVLARKAADSL